MNCQTFHNLIESIKRGDNNKIHCDQENQKTELVVFG